MLEDKKLNLSLPSFWIWVSSILFHWLSSLFLVSVFFFFSLQEVPLQHIIRLDLYPSLGLWSQTNLLWAYKEREDYSKNTLFFFKGLQYQKSKQQQEKKNYVKLDIIKMRDFCASKDALGEQQKLWREKTFCKYISDRSLF